jgi:hypothetical protein
VTDRPPGLHAEARRIADRLNGLLHRTITQHRLVTTQAGASSDVVPHIHLGFRQGGPVLAPLRSRFGQIGLYVGQIFRARAAGEEGPALIMVKYRYALYVGLDAETEPAVRWEFDRQPADPDARWSRRHLQGPIPLTFGPVTVSLNTLHLPTGTVTLEDVIRFCIHDLGVPPLSRNWHDILIQSAGESRDLLTGGP